MPSLHPASATSSEAEGKSQISAPPAGGCAAQGETPRDPPSSGGGTKKPKICKICKETSHPFSFCPKATCSICKNTGHVASFCALKSHIEHNETTLALTAAINEKDASVAQVYTVINDYRNRLKECKNNAERLAAEREELITQLQNQLEPCPTCNTIVPRGSLEAHQAKAHAPRVAVSDPQFRLILANACRSKPTQKPKTSDSDQLYASIVRHSSKRERQEDPDIITTPKVADDRPTHKGAETKPPSEPPQKSTHPPMEPNNKSLQPPATLAHAGAISQLAEGAAKERAVAQKRKAEAQRNLDKDDDDDPPQQGVQQQQGSQSYAEAAAEEDTSSKSECPNEPVRLSRPPLNSTGGKRLDVRSTKGVLGDAPGTPESSRSQSQSN